MQTKMGEILVIIIARHKLNHILNHQWSHGTIGKCDTDLDLVDHTNLDLAVGDRT